MNSVADASHRGFERSWHEAVAIVLELASHLSQSQSVPSPKDVLLSPDGTLAVRFGSEDGLNPVSGCAGLLGQLLEGTGAPAPLLQLASENASEAPRHGSLDGFTRALQFFERPGRTNDLVAVAGRLAHFAPREPETELKLLQQKLADAPTQPPKSEKRSSRLRRIAVAATVVTAIVAAAGFAGAKRLVPRPALRSAIAHAMDRADGAVTKLLTAGGAVTPEAPAPAPEAAHAAPKSIHARPVSSSRRSLGSSPRTVDGAEPRHTTVTPNPAPTQSGAATSDAADTGSRLRGLGPTGAPAAAVAGPDEQVYTDADPSVVPPRILRPQLASRPAPTPLTSYYELLIDEAGKVAAVKIVSPKRRYYDVMLAAAAKAWMFTPAVRGGHPVKYSIRIPINVPESFQ